MSEASEYIRIRPKAVLLLEALLAGMTVQVGGRELVLVDDEETGRKVLGSKSRVTIMSGGARWEEDMLARQDWAISRFIEEAETLSPEDCMTLSGSIALIRMNKPRVLRSEA